MWVGGDQNGLHIFLQKINRFVVDLSLVALVQEAPFLCNFIIRTYV